MKEVFNGKSGKECEYIGHPIQAENYLLPEGPANYIFARVGLLKTVVLYVGETSNMKERMVGHHKIDCAIAHGATHIFYHTRNLSEEGRLYEEADIIHEYHPLCNGQTPQVRLRRE